MNNKIAHFTLLILLNALFLNYTYQFECVALGHEEYNDKYRKFL